MFRVRVFFLPRGPHARLEFRAADVVVGVETVVHLDVAKVNLIVRVIGDEVHAARQLRLQTMKTD